MVSRLAKAAALGLFCFGLVCLFGSALYWPRYRAHVLLIGGWTVVGMAAGLLVAGDSSWTKRMRDLLASGGALAAAALVVSAVLAALIYWCGMRQFGGFDHSAMIEVAWRIYNGQLPYLDFPCPLPPGFYLGSSYAFKCFGVYWQSLVLICAIFSALTLYWSLWLLVQLVSNRWHCLVFATALQALCLVPASYWWYNTSTAVAALIFVLSAIVWLEHPCSIPARVSYFIALLLLAGMKPNIAAILILPTTAILLFSPPHRVRVATDSIGAFAVFSLGLKLQGISVFDMVAAYRGISQRAFVIGNFWRDASQTEVLLSLLGLILVLLPLALWHLASGRLKTAQGDCISYIGICAPRSFVVSKNWWRSVAVGTICLVAGLLLSH